jgi:acetoin utilization deacetylase AcuC-like enzyme
LCLFNNLAVAAEALRDWGIGKIAIVDFDGHHGNGTQDSFWEEPDILFASCHQFPYYPGTGAREERGAGLGLDATLNYPLPAGAGDETVIPWFEGELAAALRRFKPRFLLVSAGFDAHAADPLVMLNLSTAGFARISAVLVELAEELCGGRLVASLEGGYDLEALRESVAAHLEALAAGV